MKKGIVVLTIIYLLSLMNVEATIESGYLPGGKNYLDYNNFTVSSTYLQTNDPIRVKPNTIYTLTLPSSDVLGNTRIYLYGSEEYLYDYVYNHDECYEVDDKNVCTFNILDDEFIEIEIEGDTIGLYDHYYQFEIYQLEEGSVSTEYEEYIAPIYDTSSPEFNATGAYITSYKDFSTLQEIISSHVYSIDDVDGDISGGILIEEDGYSSFIGEVGNYSVTLSSTDSSNNTSYFELIIIVKDEIAPIITGNETIDVNINHLYSIEEVIASNLVITDDYDGVLTYQILTDNYTENKSIVGSYTVTINAVDSSSNETSKTVTINVIDYDSPVLVSSDIYETDITVFESLDDIVSTLVFTDNVDDSVIVEQVSDNYQNNELVVGVYFVDVVVSDSSNNIQNYTITIHVMDSVYPTIEGVNTVSYSYLNPASLDEIKELLTVSDNYSLLTIDDVVIKEETYLSRTSDLGEYYIVFSILDESGNEATHQVDISLIDDQAPIIFVDNYIVKINPTVSFTKEDLIYLMFQHDLVEETEYDIDVLINEYEGNESNPGMYLYQVKLTSDNGDEIVKDFIIEVLDEETKDYTSIFSTGVVIILVIGFVIIKKKK